MKHILSLSLLALLMVAPACSDADEGGSAQGDIAAPGDGSVDGVAQDSGASDAAVAETTDSVEDVAIEVVEDVPEDLVEEVTPDAVADTSGDADAADTATDTTTDGSSDIPPDVTSDVTPDAEDAGVADADVATDVMMDAPMDIAEDAGPQPEFGTMLTVSESSGAELFAMAVLESGLVVILWRSGDNDILLSPIDPLTSTVSDPIVIEADAGNGSISKGGDVVAMGNHLAVIWWSKNPGDEPDASGDQNIRFKVGTIDDLSAPGVTLATEGNEDLWRPHLVVGAQDTLCALWQRDKDVKMTCSVDQGASFGDETTVEPAGVSATLSSGAFLNTGELVVSYMGKIGAQNSVYVTKTNDLGQTWSAPVDVGITSGVGQALNPTMAPGTAGQIHLAWYNSYQGTTSAWHTTSMDGSTWGAPLELPTIQSWVALKPGRAANLHISGQDNIPGYGTTHYMTSADDGQSWGVATPIPVTPGFNPPIEFHAELEANLVEGWLHLAWWEGGVNDQSLRFVTVEP